MNGAYGRRMETICGFLEGVSVDVLDHPEDEAVSPERLELHLRGAALTLRSGSR